METEISHGRADRTDPPVKPSAYKTSKQVQAWFLSRSRDLWKKKYAELKVEFKRLQQQVADVCRSRADWRGKAEAARPRSARASGPDRRTPDPMGQAFRGIAKKKRSIFRPR